MPFKSFMPVRPLMIRPPMIGILLMLAAAFCLYIPVLNAPFLFDDYSSIVDNTAIRTLDLEKIYAFKPLRFVGYLSFALNFHFSQLNPLPYHLVNIAIHLLYGVFAFLLVQTLWKTPSGRDVPLDNAEKTALSLAVAAVLLLHPVSVFAVSYIVQRLASLTALLYVITLLCYLRCRLAETPARRWLYALGGIVFLTGALFSKENAFTLFPQILFFELLCFPLTSARIRGLIMGVFAGTAILGMVVYHDLIDLNAVNRLTMETSDLSRWEYLLTQFSVICFYLRSFFVPTGLALDYDRYILDSLADPLVWIPGLVLVGLMVFAGWLATKKPFRLAALGLVFYFTAASIESGLIPIRDTIFLHRVYLPNLGLAFFTVVLGYLGLKRLGLRPGLILAVFCLWLTVLSGVAFQTNRILKSPVTAWERVLEISPGYMRAYQVLGNYYVTREGGDSKDVKADYAKARAYIFRVHQHFPDNIKNLNNMGILYNRERQYEKAIATFERVIQLKKRYGPAYANLGATYCNMQRYDLALDVLEKGYHMAPDNFTLLLQYGQLLAILAPGPRSQYEKALAILERAQAINDQDPILFYAKGLALFNLNKYDKSKEQFQKVLARDPSFEEAARFLDQIQDITSG